MTSNAATYIWSESKQSKATPRRTERGMYTENITQIKSEKKGK